MPACLQTQIDQLPDRLRLRGEPVLKPEVRDPPGLILSETEELLDGVYSVLAHNVDIAAVTDVDNISLYPYIGYADGGLRQQSPALTT